MTVGTDIIVGARRARKTTMTMISREGTSCGRSPGGEFNYLLLFSFRMQSTENLLFVRKNHHHHHDDEDDEDRKDKKDRDEDEDDGKIVCLLIQFLLYM